MNITIISIIVMNQLDFNAMVTYALNTNTKLLRDNQIHRTGYALWYAKLSSKCNFYPFLKLYKWTYNKMQTIKEVKQSKDILIVTSKKKQD